MSGASAAAAANADNSYKGALDLMKKMGSKSGFDPIPPDQHAWATGKDQPPLMRFWGAMCHHTIHWGHRKEYAVTKEGVALTVENIAAILEMDEGNARKTWREGVERGLWRNGTVAEGRRRLYLCGTVAPFKGESKANGGISSDLFEDYPPYQREAIKALSDDKRREFLAASQKLSLCNKAAFAEWVAAFREVGAKNQDTLFIRFGIPKIRESRKADALTEEELQALRARQARIVKLAPIAEQLVLTFEQTVQSVETGQYNASSTHAGTPSTLLSVETLEKNLEGGRNSSTAPQSSSKTRPKNEESPANQLPAPQQRDTRSREAKRLVAQQVQEKRKKEREALKPEPEDAAHAEAMDALFTHLENMQTAYPHTDFSYEQVSRENPGDRATVRQIVGIVKRDIVGFVIYVASKFRGLDRNALGKMPARSPENPNGPRSLGLVLEWAKDYARGNRAVPPVDRAADAEKSEYQQRLRARRTAEKTLSDPSASEIDKAEARELLAMAEATHASGGAS